MKNISRSPFFWLILTTITAGSIFFAIKYFPAGFPIVNLELTMNRQQGLHKADELAKKYGWGPANYRQAASFQVDDEVKNYVELEAGGNQALTAMLKGDLYMPYTWQVRHFKEQETNETYIAFKPDGTPYGFRETLAENTPGAALEQSAAQAIAEQAAIRDWHIKLEEYVLIEHSKEAKPNGRIDHVFVYERPNIKIGLATYRIRLQVTGDKFTGLGPLVKVPENFTLKYLEMRSANNSIATAADLAHIILYLFGGCIIGLIFLLRRRRIIWLQPLLFGIFIAFIAMLINFNKLPLAWMEYETALSTTNFLISYFIRSFANFGVSTIFFATIIAAAEGLTRTAFGNHPQVWTWWSPINASSLPIIGRTVGGYMTACLHMAYVVATYAFASKYFGWWTPSSTLFDPNILATYIPWLSTIGSSLEAGFIEECLFRAIPLSCAALIGRRFGYERTALVIAFIVQALIFGGAHANYPAQPAYARLAELIIPSLMFASIYLAYGLLASIIAHTTYDIFWFGLPLFVSKAPGAWINQLIIIVLTFIPLLVLLYAWLRTKKINSVLSAESYNNAWQPPTEREKATPAPEQPAQQITFKVTHIYFILASGIIGFCLWLGFTRFHDDTQQLTITRTTAIEKAREVITARGFKLDTPWQPLAMLHTSYKLSTSEELQNRFIWQKAGPKIYQQLTPTYVSTPSWIIRFVRFEGSLQERSEEWSVVIADNGTVLRVAHELPEMQPGVTLNEEQARAKVHEHLKTVFKLDPLTLHEISAQILHQPARKDWRFIFENKAVLSLPEGQARIGVDVGGNEIVDSYGHIHTPETFDREEQNKATQQYIIQFLSTYFLYFISLLSILALLYCRRPLSLHWLISIGILFSGIALLEQANSMSLVISCFNTTEPFYQQLFMKVGWFIVTILAKGAFYAYLAALIAGANSTLYLPKTPVTAFLGICLGFFASGITTFTRGILPRLEPLWAGYEAFGTYLPVFSTASSLVLQFFTSTLFLMLFIGVLNNITNHWHKFRAASLLLLFAVGIAIAGSEWTLSISQWLILGASLGVRLIFIYLLALRFDHSLVPLVTGIFFTLHAIQQAFMNGYTGAPLNEITAGIAIMIVAYIWFRKLK